MLSCASIKAGGAGIADYYEGLAGRDDYYTHGGEPPGRWVGQHAERLGLSGTVQKGELGAAIRGFHPHTGEALAGNAGDKHHGGYDLTFSAPKSVSAVWAAADWETRKAISDSQQRAVESALAKAELDGAFRTLHGHAGAEKRDYTGGLCAATFEHSTSRNGDPQLHTHTIVANLTPDGRRLDFDTYAKMSLGAAYRAELAHELQKMGFQIERDKSSFRIHGVDKHLEKDMSSRRQEILKELKEKGMSGGRASAAATLATREKKGEVDREQLFARAQLTAESYGLTAEKITELRQPLPEHERTPERIEAERMPDHEAVMRQATEQASTITPRQLETVVMQEAQGRMSLADAEKYLAELKQQSEHLIELRDQDGNTRYTSKEMYELERRLADQAAVMAADQRMPVRAESLAAALDAKAASATEKALADPTRSAEEKAMLAELRGLSIEQRDALYQNGSEDMQKLMRETQGLSDQQREAFQILTSSERLTLLEGTAGTGKSFLLDTCRDAWERDGYSVTGCALAAKAARGLTRSASIESRTIHSTLHRLDSGKVTLDNKSIVVVDEAGMAGSRLMSRLQDHVDKAGAKLVIVGDTKQLQPVDAGGAMRAQRQALEHAGQKHAELTEIRRQVREGDRQMVLDAKAGRGQAVVDYLQAENRIVVHEKRDDVLKAMARDTVDQLAAGRQGLAMAETNAETYAINQAARELAREAGMVTGDDAKFSAERGERQFATGDRIYFLQNNEKLGVDNGTLGTVEKAEDGRLTVKLDECEVRVTVDQREYQHVDHGFAATVHKSQGDTVDSASYAPGRMADSELSYVALSRHRDTVTVHVTKDQLPDLAERFSRSHAKDTSADYTKVEKYQGEIDRAEARVNAAEAQIAKLEKQIQQERQKLEKPLEPAQRDPQTPIGQREIAAHADNQVSQTNERQNHGNPSNEPQPDRYAALDPERLAASRAAAVRVADRAGDASGRAPEPVDALRDVSRIAVVHERTGERAAGHEMHVPSDERNHLAAGRSGDPGLRRVGAGAGEADRRNEQAVARSPRLDKLEKRLAEARAERGQALKAEDRARLKQAAIWEKAKAAPAERSTTTERQYPKFEAQPKPNTEQAIQRDGDLARKALDAHRAGERLPEGKKLDKAIKSGELRPTKDSEGRVYFERKDGKVFARDLNRPEPRRTESRNINHALLTKQKFMVIDKKILGLKVGTQVLKSGGTLKTELSGKLRDKLQAATAGKGIGKATARTLTKPVDNALKRGERWQKAGAVESAIVKLQLKVEQKLAERQAVKALEAKVKAAEKPAEKIHDKAQQQAKEHARAGEKGKEQARAPERDRAPHAERENPAERINDLTEQADKLNDRTAAPDRSREPANPAPSSRGADLAADLANRPVPTQAPAPSHAPTPAPKAAERSFER